MILFKRYRVKSLTKKLKIMQEDRLHNQPSDELLAKEKSLCHQLAKLYKLLRGDKKIPFADEMVWESLRAAANLDDTEGQYQLAIHLLELGQFRMALQSEGVFASASNERQAKQAFEEAVAYLIAADKLKHIGAKRMYGLCHIHGWGVEENREKGFNLIVDSIAEENAWDRVPQIFASIGLNKPEFFAALTKHRQKV